MFLQQQESSSNGTFFSLLGPLSSSPLSALSRSLLLPCVSLCPLLSPSSSLVPSGALKLSTIFSVLDTLQLPGSLYRSHCETCSACLPFSCFSLRNLTCSTDLVQFVEKKTILHLPTGKRREKDVSRRDKPRDESHLEEEWSSAGSLEERAEVFACLVWNVFNAVGFSRHMTNSSYSS